MMRQETGIAVKEVPRSLDAKKVSENCSASDDQEGQSTFFWRGSGREGAWCSDNFGPKTPHSMASASLVLLDLEMNLGGFEGFWIIIRDNV